MLSTLDYLIIVMYFGFIAGLGWFFRRAGAGSSSDYFRGGGRMPWWLVGSSVFMTAFSAWTFTGAAGLAYDVGLVALIIFWANSFGLVLTAIKFGPWFRQTRAVTGTEAIRQRLGLGNQQLLLWLGLPLSVFRAAAWLYGLAIFLSPVFQLDLTTVIIVTGLVVTLMAMLGGSWAAITGDLVQALLLIPITLLAAWFACEKVGGIGPLFEKLPPGHLDLVGSSISGYGVLWLVALFVEKLIFANNLTAVGRFLTVRSSVDAQRAAWLAAALFLFGTIVWFIPPLAARALGLDLAAQFPGISSPRETAYAAVALITLPPGLLGFLVTGLLAATMSSMDTGLNANAGTFVRGVYLPLIRPHATERELVIAGRTATATMGLLIVLLALKYTTWHNHGVFEIMFDIAAMLTVPTVVPALWCLFTRRSPDWATWSTMLVGFAISFSLGYLTQREAVVEWFGAAGAGDWLTWLRKNQYAAILLVNTTVCSLWFWGVTLLHRPPAVARQREIDGFLSAMHRPVTAEPHPDDNRIVDGIARLCLYYGAFICLAALYPNSWRGHGGLLFCAGFFFVVGFALRGWSKHVRSTPTVG